MNNEFLKYLLYISLIIIVFFTAAVFIIKKRGLARSVQAPEAITFGYVSTFFDENRNVIVIPYVKDKYQNGRDIGECVHLNAPYSMEKLGNTVRNAMRLCETGSPRTDNTLMKRLNAQDWKSFSQSRKNISVHYQEGHGLVFNTTTRNADGSYQFNHAGFEKTVGNRITDTDLGETLYSLLGRCR